MIQNNYCTIFRLHTTHILLHPILSRFLDHTRSCCWGLDSSIPVNIFRIFPLLSGNKFRWDTKCSKFPQTLGKCLPCIPCTIFHLRHRNQLCKTHRLQKLRCYPKASILVGTSGWSHMDIRIRQGRRNTFEISYQSTLQEDI